MGAKGNARMWPRRAKYIANQIGSGVHDQRLLHKLCCTAHKARQTNHPHHARQISTGSRAQICQYVQRAYPRGGLTDFNTQISTNDTLEQQNSVLARPLPCYEHKLSRARKRQIVALRRVYDRQFNTQGFQSAIKLVHGRLSSVWIRSAKVPASTLPPLRTTTTVFPATSALPARTAAKAAAPPGSTTSFSCPQAKRTAAKTSASVTVSAPAMCFLHKGPCQMARCSDQ